MWITTMLRLPLVVLMLVGPVACAGDDGQGGGAAADDEAPGQSSESPASDVLSVTILGSDGAELGTFAVSPEDVEGRLPGVTRAGTLTAATMVLAGTGAAIGTATLKTRATGPGDVRLDDRGESADALRLVFWVPQAPEGVAGQYESSRGTAHLTVVEDDRIAGTFDGVFDQQAGGGERPVRGSFDFQGRR